MNSTTATYPRYSLYLVSLGHLLLEMANNSLPIIYPVLVAANVISYTRVGTIVFIVGMWSSLAQPLFGYLSDRWAPQVVIGLSVAASGAAIALTGFSASWTVLLACVTLAMTGSAAFHPAAAIVAAASARGARGAAVSVFSVGGNLGSTIGPVLVAATIAAFGSRGTAAVFPPVILGAVTLLVLLGRAHRTRSTYGGGDSGLLARQGSWAALALVVIAAGFRMWFQTSFGTYLPAWFEEQGYTLTFAAQMLSVFTACSALGSLLGGTLADRIGSWQLMAIALALLGPSSWLLLQVAPALHAPLVGFVGVLVGANYPVAIVAAQESWPRGPGLATGLALGLAWIGSAAGGLITGRLVDQVSAQYALQWLFIPSILALVCALAYPLARGREAQPADCVDSSD